MPYRPLFQVNDFRLTKRTNPASRYSDTVEKIDLWKVFLAHGYYAGLGMDFWFPTEGEASRFSLWTVYDQGQIIDAMDNRNFQVWKVAKTFRMGARNRYTGVRALQDFWRVALEGEREDFLDIYFPTELEANSFSFGRVYSMTDLFGTMPGVPQDMALLLHERAARLREQAGTGTAAGGGGPGGADEPPGGNPPPAPPPPPVPPPPPAPIPPTPYQQLQTSLLNAAQQLFYVTSGGAAGYYARSGLLLAGNGQRWSNVALDFKSLYTYFPTGQFAGAAFNYRSMTGYPFVPQGLNQTTPLSFYGWYVNSPLINP